MSRVKFSILIAVLLLTLTGCGGNSDSGMGGWIVGSSHNTRMEHTP
jgi:hypothetical protein